MQPQALDLIQSCVERKREPLGGVEVSLINDCPRSRLLLSVRVTSKTVCRSGDGFAIECTEL